MTKTISHPNMNDNNDNDIIQSIDAASELVAEVPHDITGEILGEEIDILIAFDNNQHNVQFGQAEYWPVPFATLFSYYFFGILHRQRAVNIPHRCIAAAIVLLLVLPGCVYLISQLNIEDTPEHDAHMYVTLDDDQQNIIMKEKYKCFCPNSMEKNDLDVDIHNKINTPSTYIDQGTHLKETSVIEIVDNSTCALYDVFLYVFMKFFCLTYEKTDASKIEQNGAVLTENARPTNLYIPKETSPIDSNKEIENKDA